MYKVLIVDDEQLIRSGMIARFQYLNFKFERIREAASGVEALALLEKEPADIVITDIKMPDMDGMTLIREAKEKYPGTQFVILSGYAEFEYAETAIELGVKSYLLKPISNDELKRVRGNYLRRWKKSGRWKWRFSGNISWKRNRKDGCRKRRSTIFGRTTQHF